MEVYEFSKIFKNFLFLRNSFTKLLEETFYTSLLELFYQTPRDAIAAGHITILISDHIMQSLRKVYSHVN